MEGFSAMILPGTRVRQDSPRRVLVFSKIIPDLPTTNVSSVEDMAAEIRARQYLLTKVRDMGRMAVEIAKMIPEMGYQEQINLLQNASLITAEITKMIAHLPKLTKEGDVEIMADEMAKIIAEIQDLPKKTKESGDMLAKWLPEIVQHFLELAEESDMAVKMVYYEHIQMLTKIMLEMILLADELPTMLPKMLMERMTAKIVELFCKICDECPVHMKISHVPCVSRSAFASNAECLYILDESLAKLLDTFYPQANQAIDFDILITSSGVQLKRSRAKKYDRHVRHKKGLFGTMVVEVRTLEEKPTQSVSNTDRSSNREAADFLNRILMLFHSRRRVCFSDLCLSKQCKDSYDNYEQQVLLQLQPKTVQKKQSVDRGIQVDGCEKIPPQDTIVDNTKILEELQLYEKMARVRDLQISDLKKQLEEKLTVTPKSSATNPKVHLIDMAGAPEFLYGTTVHRKIVLEVVGDKPQKLEWAGHGFYLDVPEGALPPGVTATVTVKIALGGKFHFPENRQLTSALYWVSSNVPFQKEVVVNIEHCAVIKNDEDCSSFRFVVASKCSQEALSYSFRERDGVFNPHTQYGAFKLKQLSFFGATAPINAETHCAALMFYKQQVASPLVVDFQFVVVKDLELFLQNVYDEYQGWSKDSHARKVRFNGKTTLLLDQQEEVVDSWKIIPLSSLTITSSSISYFTPGRTIPTCAFELQLVPGKPLQRLFHKVDVVGVPSLNSFYIRYPQPEYFAQLGIPAYSLPFFSIGIHGIWSTQCSKLREICCINNIDILYNCLTRCILVSSLLP